MKVSALMIFFRLFPIIFFCTLPLKLFAGVCGQKTEIIVICHERKLFLCEEGHLRQQFYVALGKGGINKKISGDFKTPIGDYALDLPRPSDCFGTFIPIEYPTPNQILLGYSGDDVGIHGPPKFSWLGRLISWKNWTAGCIAVARKSEIDEIASWVMKHQPVNIRILS